MSNEFKKDTKKKFKVDGATFTLWFILIAFVLFVTWAIVSVVQDENTKMAERNNTEIRYIKSCISSDDSIFILGIGGLNTGVYDTIEYYFYMERDKGYSLEHIPASRIKIVELEDDTQPYIEGHFNKDGKLITLIETLGELDMDYSSDMINYTIYIPKGYKTESFNMAQVEGVNK